MKLNSRKLERNRGRWAGYHFRDRKAERGSGHHAFCDYGTVSFKVPTIVLPMVIGIE